MQRLVGKVALVTGAGRQGGLGAAIAMRLAAEGAAVVVSDLAASSDLPADRVGSEDGIGQVVAAITQGGGRAVAQALDVRDEPMVEAAISRAVKEFGRLDILINNAGIMACPLS